MFLQFYQMREQPFGTTPDPRFLYLGKSHREALASLFYGMQANCGFTALIANPGLGKTTLTFQALENFQRSARIVFLSQTQCNSRELLHYVLDELGVDSQGMNIASMHKKLKEIVSQEVAAGHRFILAVDEAQNFDSDVLETIRLLSNLETPQTKLLQILLVGQPQLATKLASPALLQLEQRISVFAGLKPFDINDTGRYIAHRLLVAGYVGQPLFSREALEMIQGRSQGIPRNINRLCFNALSIGCATESKIVDSKIMREVFTDLDVNALGNQLAFSVSDTKVESGQFARPFQPLKIGGLKARATCVAAACVAAGIMLWPSSTPKTKNAPPSLMLSAPITTSGGAAERFISNTEAVQTFPLNAPIVRPESKDSHRTQANTVRETITVVVKSGDDLRKIVIHAIGHYDDAIVKTIRELNPDLTDENRIEVGQQLILPRTRGILDTHFLPDAIGSTGTIAGSSSDK
jgi:type II secretory pathway predicted ATPase ExeA